MAPTISNTGPSNRRNLKEAGPDEIEIVRSSFSDWRGLRPPGQKKEFTLASTPKKPRDCLEYIIVHEMMERAFKSLLVERSKQQFRLTPQGRVLYDYGKQILQLYGSLDSKRLELKDIISGTIRVVTSRMLSLWGPDFC